MSAAGNGYQPLLHSVVHGQDLWGKRNNKLIQIQKKSATINMPPSILPVQGPSQFWVFLPLQCKSDITHVSERKNKGKGKLMSDPLMYSSCWTISENPIIGHWTEVTLLSPVKCHRTQERQHDLSSVEDALSSMLQTHSYPTPQWMQPEAMQGNGSRKRRNELRSLTIIFLPLYSCTLLATPCPPSSETETQWTKRNSPSVSFVSQLNLMPAKLLFQSTSKALTSTKFHHPSLFFPQYLSEVKVWIFMCKNHFHLLFLNLFLTA